MTLALYRLSHKLYSAGFTALSSFTDRLNRVLFACWIPGSATIGKNFKVGYQGLGVVIHSNTIIGNHCLVGQHVTIGGKFGETVVPRLGNKVYVGAGAAIIGNICIGDGVIVGANAVVLKSVPSRAVVAGNPARIIRTESLDHVALRKIDKDSFSQQIEL